MTLNAGDGVLKVPVRSSKQGAALVILVLMALVLSFVEFPIFPPAPWLKYDPSGIIALLATLLYGPWVGCGVAVVAWVPHLVTDPLGAFMNIMASLVIVITMGLMYWNRPSLRRAIVGAIVGSALSVAVSILLNFVVTPFYLSITYEDIVAMVVPYLLPFNAMKSVLNCIVALASYRALAKLLAEKDEKGGKGNTVEKGIASEKDAESDKVAEPRKAMREK